RVAPRFCSRVYVFFFSSRRRHTRSKRDWSSDVCSSDLASRRGWGVPAFLVTGIVLTLTDKQTTQRQVYEIAELGKPPGAPTRTRSEERRVGKEWRTRWWREC